MQPGALVRTVLTAALAGTALVAPTAGAADSHLLVVEGAGSSFVDFEVVEQVLRLDLDGVTIAGGRTYAGVHITPLDREGPYVVSAIRAQWLAADAHAVGSELPPGRYRARLLADGPARVAFPLETQAPGRVLRTKTALPVRRAIAQREVASGRSDARLRVDDAVPAGWQSLFGFRVTGERVERTAACLTSGSRCRSLPAALPLVEEPDIPAGTPSQSNEVGVRMMPPAAEARDAVLEVEGHRTTDGVLRSLVLAFRDPA